MVNYWWASQNVNYKTVIPKGTLWTCPRDDGRPDPTRDMIKQMRPGDIVFHHADTLLRAVSRVNAPWKDWKRPVADYPKIFQGEGDDGWLVTLDPIRTDFKLHFSRVAELIRLGPGAPLNKAGKPVQKFLSKLSPEDGLELLKELGLPVPAPAPAPDEGSLFGRPDEWDGGETDAVSLTSVRQEQADLRSHLLKGRPTAPCAICGEERPARLLVAAHIKPRSRCTEEERKAFRSVAMLACSLGCDALFGWGYIVVDSEGKVRRGVKAETDHVRDAVDLLIGKVCGAHNEDTAAGFAAHADLMLEPA